MKYIEGNLITMAENGEFDVIIHGCNCLNVMGSGIAAEIKSKYPLAFEADIKASTIWKEPVAKLGNFSTATVVSPNNTPFIIVNAYTQVNFSPRGIDHFEYESFHVILKKLLVLAKSGVRFGFPYIGMGLAGGDSNRIIPMIQTFSTQASANGASTTLVEFKP